MFKNKSKRKRNFATYHFLVKSKPHERIDLLIMASVNILFTRQKKYSNSNENMLLRKSDETIWKSPLSKGTPLFLNNFFMTPLFFPISKMRTPTP